MFDPALSVHWLAGRVADYRDHIPTNSELPASVRQSDGALGRPNAKTSIVDWFPRIPCPVQRRRSLIHYRY